MLLIVNTRVSFFLPDGEINKKRLLAVIIITLGCLQVIYGVINYNFFREGYLNTAHENTGMLTNIIQRDIDSVIEKGVSYGELYQVEDYLDRIIREVQEVDRIYITGREGEIMHSTASINEEDLAGEDFLYYSPLQQDHLEKEAFINVELSQQNLAQRIQEILLDTATMVVISLIFMVEVTILIVLFLSGRFRKMPSRVAEKEVVATETEMPGQELLMPSQDSTVDSKPSHYGLLDTLKVRPLTFLLFMAIFTPNTFIPLYMRQLYEPMFGLSQGVILGLPISAEMFFGIIALLVAGPLIERRGWRFAFFTGLAAFAGGTVLSALSWSGYMFILARCFTGIGYGFFLMALRAYILLNPSPEDQSEGVTAFTSGLYAGVNVGVMFGAMMADRIGFSQVFYMILAYLFMAGIFAFYFIKKEPARELAPEPVAETGAKGSGLKEFFTNRYVIAFFLLILLPITFSGMFLDYYFPIFAEDTGVSSSNIGRAFLLNGLCIVYLGPLLSRYSSKFLGVRRAILASGLIVSSGLLIFALYGTLWAAFAVVLLLGLSDSFGLVAQNNFFLGLEATHSIGPGKALGYFNIVRKAAQMLGPIGFGLALEMGMSQGITVIGILILLFLILFSIITRPAARLKQAE